MGYKQNVVIDLEFTPITRRKRTGSLRQEIIEIGAIKIGHNGDAPETFSMPVRPTLTAGVSAMVQHMTGIGNEDLIGAKTLGEALHRLSEWIGEGPSRMVTWSDTDRRQIIAECLAKGISIGLPNRWLDLQRIYPRLMGTRKRLVALDEAADWCGVEFDHHKAHRALYDAQVTAKLFSMAAAGECRIQRHVIDKTMHAPSNGSPCTMRMPDPNGALAALRASLLASEAALCA